MLGKCFFHNKEHLIAPNRNTEAELCAQVPLQALFCIYEKNNYPTVVKHETQEIHPNQTL